MYKEIKTHETVSEEDALDYVIKHTTEEERNYYLVEWFFSGNWDEIKEDEDAEL